MAIDFKDLHAEELLEDLEKACLHEQCGSCDKASCIIGYAQECLKQCLMNKVTYVENGAAKIPMSDFKHYEEAKIADAIASILNICRSCGTEHFENCLINVIRNCYEVSMFGETQPYEGSALRYLAKINMQKLKDAEMILEAYHNKRNM